MNSVIFSPHTDDAIFSLASYLINKNNYTVASAFAGIPTDDVGFKKHSILRKEHSDACSSIGIKEVNNDLLDDVYGLQDINILNQWIEKTIVNFDNIYIPLGIHHPDHILLSNELVKLINKYDKNFYFYSELPYRLLFPEKYLIRSYQIKSKINCKCIQIELNMNKEFFIKKYKSQIGTNNEVVPYLMTHEEIWQVIK